jgi:mitogen-activated protein kinase 1/3
MCILSTGGPGYYFEICLCTGAFSIVNLGYNRLNSTKVAIKKMDGVFDDEIDCKRILREVNLLKQLDHPFIIEIFDIIEPKDPRTFDSIYIVIRLSESDLKKVIKSSINL